MGLVANDHCHSFSTQETVDIVNASLSWGPVVETLPTFTQIDSRQALLSDPSHFEAKYLQDVVNFKDWVFDANGNVTQDKLKRHYIP